MAISIIFEVMYALCNSCMISFFPEEVLIAGAPG